MGSIIFVRLKWKAQSPNKEWRRRYGTPVYIELCSIPWSSPIAAPQTFAGSVSNG
jgi:hypothetical protein